MDSQPQFVIPLADVTQSDESLVGAKSARLGALAKAGHPVAPGFCVTVRAYDLFLAESRLAGLIRMELDRKRIGDMRWGENDNLLLARVESQLIRALTVAARQLKAASRLTATAPVTSEAAEAIIAALRDRSAGAVVLPEPTATERIAPAARPGETPRQLAGQPVGSS